MLSFVAQLSLANHMDLAVASIAGKAQSLDITKNSEDNVSNQLLNLTPENAVAIEADLKQIEQNYYAQIDVGTIAPNHDPMQTQILQNKTLSNYNVNGDCLKELTDKNSVNHKKIIIKQDNELLKTANNIQASTNAMPNGQIFVPEIVNIDTQNKNKILTCREPGNPVIKKCYKNRVIKVVKPLDVKFVLEVYFSAQSYDGHSTTVDLKDGAINYANATAGNAASHVVNPLNQRLMGAKIVSMRHIESRWWSESGVHTGSVSHIVTQMPSIENNFVYKNTIVQDGIHGRASRRRNSDKYRGRVEKWEITAMPDAVLEDSWDDAQCLRLAEFAANNFCKGPVIKLMDVDKTKIIENYPNPITRSHWQEEHVYTCGGGGVANECQALHKSSCTQTDSQCINASGPFCVEYLQTFNCAKNQVTLNANKSVINVEAVENVGTVNVFDIDGFGNAIGQLSIIDELKKNIIRPTDGTVLLFKGEQLTCDKDWGGDIKNCCNLKGIFKNIIGHKCPEHVEKTLAPAVVRERRCVEVAGWQCLAKTLGRCHKWRKSFCCYQSRIARIFQQIAHRQLSIDWGSAEHPNCGPLDPHTFGKINFDDPYARGLLAQLINEANANAQNYANKANSKFANSQELNNKITALQERVGAYYANRLQSQGNIE
jgi:hypothetical protein